MEPANRGTVLELLREVRRCYPEKDIWCYTGYDYEKDLLRWAKKEQAGIPPGGGQTESTESKASAVAELLELIDVLVDGEFVEERKDLRLAFRGSGNQRLIDVQASLKQGRVVCLEL